MKKCPYCAEDIQDAALKCKHCGEFLPKNLSNNENRVLQEFLCPYCSAVIDHEENNCKYCSNDLEVFQIYKNYSDQELLKITETNNSYKEIIVVAAKKILNQRQQKISTANSGIRENELSLSILSNFEYAGFWKRFIAALIDGVSFVLFDFLFVLIISSTKPNLIELSLIEGSMIWVYCALMESSFLQATLGKLALGIKVTDLKGNQISFARATVRHFAKIISSVILLIGWFMAAFTEKKQTLHDIIAECLVIKSK